MDPLWQTIHDFFRFATAWAPVGVTGIGLIRYWLRCKRKAMREQSAHMRSHVERFEGGVKTLTDRANTFEVKMQLFTERLESFGARASALEAHMGSLKEYVKRLISLYEGELKQARALIEKSIPGTGMTSLTKKRDK